MDRRTFLKVSAGAGAGRWTSASFAEIGFQAEPLRLAHFHPDHVIPARQLVKPKDAVVDFIRQEVESEKRWWSWDTPRSLQMPSEKLSLLIAMMRHIAGHYRRPDLFGDWAYRLAWREEFASSGCGGIGLGHEFQGRQELSTLERDVDWWAFLIPDGTAFDAIDGEPVYVIVVPVFGQEGMTRSIESWSAATRIAKYVNPQRLAENNPAEATDRLNQALSRSLHEVGHQDLHHSNGRHT